MDEQPIRQQGHMGSNTGGGTTTLDQNRTQQQSGTTANQVMEQTKTTANQAMDQAKTMARNIGDQAAAAAADPPATAQDLARLAREQATRAGGWAYRQRQ